MVRQRCDFIVANLPGVNAVEAARARVGTAGRACAIANVRHGRGRFGRRFDFDQGC